MGLVLLGVSLALWGVGIYLFVRGLRAKRSVVNFVRAIMPPTAMSLPLGLVVGLRETEQLSEAVWLALKFFTILIGWFALMYMGHAAFPSRRPPSTSIQDNNK